MRRAGLAVIAGAAAIAGWMLLRSAHGGDRAGSTAGATASSERGTPSGSAPAPRSFICSHPFIPTAVGTELVYDVRSGTGDDVVTSRVTLRAVRALPLALAVEWRVEVEGLPPITTNARCVLGDGAEEPWFGAQLGFMEIGGPRWLWPTSLEPGTRFGGTASMALLGEHATARREHTVVGVEEVRVRAGAFTAWRVTYTDTIEDRPGSTDGTAWVSEGLGLVRLETAPAPGFETVWELANHSHP
jgi:hypothetical protein